MEDLTIEQHEAEINRIQGGIQALKREQQVHHDAMEKKIHMVPIVATSKDQVMKPNQMDPVEYIRGLSGDALAKVKSLLKGDQ